MSWALHKNGNRHTSIREKVDQKPEKQQQAVRQQIVPSHVNACPEA